jgi:hypothetical protein
MKLTPIFIALTTISLSSLSWAATPSQTTSATPATSSAKTAKSTNATAAKTTPPKSTTAKTAELKSLDLNNPEEIKNRIHYLNRRLNRIDDQFDNPKGHKDWYKYIQFSGLVNMDASYWSKPNFGEGRHDTNASSYLSLSEALLNVDAEMGDWVQAHIDFLYTNGSSPSVRDFRPNMNANRRVNVQQAYGTISNFAKSPFYLRAGQQFIPFGRFHLYPISQSFTQILSQTDLPAIQAGFISENGIYVGAYIVDGERKIHNSKSTKLSNYGFDLGYENLNHKVGYDLGIAYLRNMGDVDAIREYISKLNGYTREVGAFSAYGDIYAGPFGFSLRYVTAMRKFSQNDYQYTSGNTTQGAKPEATKLGANYDFKSFGHNSVIDLGYEWTNQAHNTASGIQLDDVTRLPKTRWSVAYGVNIIKHVALGLQYDQDKDYKTRYGGTGRRNNIVTARISYLF